MNKKGFKLLTIASLATFVMVILMTFVMIASARPLAPGQRYDAPPPTDKETDIPPPPPVTLTILPPSLTPSHIPPENTSAASTLSSCDSTLQPNCFHTPISNTPCPPNIDACMSTPFVATNPCPPGVPNCHSN